VSSAFLLETPPTSGFLALPCALTSPGVTMHQLQTRPSRSHLWGSLVVVVAAAVVGTIVTVLVLTADSDDTSSGTNPFQLELAPKAPLKTASTDCSTGMLADEDKTLVIDMTGQDYGSGTATFADIECVLDELAAPQSIVAKMGSTRALDGMKTAGWSGFEATWTYHPDDGLDMILTQTD
jgi:hypothetical protein